MPPLMIKKKLNETKSFRKDFLFKFIFLPFKRFIHVHNLFWSFYSEITLSFPPNPFFTKSLPRPHRFSRVFWLRFGESLRVVGGEGERRTETTFSCHRFHEHAYEILHWTLWSQLSRAYTIEENVSLSPKQPSPTDRMQGRGGLQESGPDLRCSVEGLTQCRCCVDSHGCTESLTTCHAWAFLTVHPSSYILPEPSSQCLLSHRGGGIYVLLRAEHWEHSRKACVLRFGRLLVPALAVAHCEQQPSLTGDGER